MTLHVDSPQLPLARNTGRAIDRIYGRFVAALPGALQEVAVRLPERLGLTSNDELPWSEAFDHPELLRLPELLAASPRLALSRELCEAAVAAHLFGMIGALGVDAITSHRVDEDAEVVAVIYELHRARDRAYARLSGGPEAAVDFGMAEALSREALREEASVFAGVQEASPERIRMFLLKRHACVFPASLAAAHAGGWSAADTSRLELVIGGVLLGLKLREKVGRWMEEHRQGRSWAVAILAYGHGAALARSSLSELAGHLEVAGVLTELLQMSSRAFANAAHSARELGLESLAAWAREQSRRTSGLALFESVEPGYTVQWELDRRDERRGEQRRELAAAS